MRFLAPWLGFFILAVNGFSASRPSPLRGQTFPPTSSSTTPAAVHRILDYDGEVTFRTANVTGLVETRFRVIGTGWCSVEIRAFFGGSDPDEWFGGGAHATGSWSPWEPVVDHPGAMSIRLANENTCQDPGGAVFSQVRYWSEVPEELLLPQDSGPTGPVERVEIGRLESSGVGPWYFSFAVKGSDLATPLVRVNRFLTEDLCWAGRGEYVGMAERMLQTGDAATQEAIRFSLNTLTECVER